jgi:hypothetical protein
MADLFDMKVGGLGFHLTAHMIAIAALFVACFAITGYITFRDNSIDGSSLKAGTVPESALVDTDGEDFLIATVSPTLALGTNNVTVGTLPARALVKHVTVITDALSVGAATADLSYTIGTVAVVDEIVTTDVIMANGALDAAYNAVGDMFHAGIGTEYSNTARDIIVQFTVATAVLTTAGSYKVQIEYTQL